jgi:hypothetical protein
MTTFVDETAKPLQEKLEGKTFGYARTLSS